MKTALLIFVFAAMPAMAQSNPFIGKADAIGQGKALYDTHCTACHGASGGSGDRAPAIVLSAAGSLRGERSEAQILDIIRTGIPGTAMPAWKGRLSDDDALKIVAYIHALRGNALDDPVPGDAAHGRAVFWDKGGCGGCHMIGGRGGVLGPDLGNIAAQRKTLQIRDALTKADHHVYGDGGVHLPAIPPMNYEAVTIVTRAGQAIDGAMVNQDAWSVQILDKDGKPRSFDRAKLTSVVVHSGSMMPTDYDKRLSKAEFEDLMAFLTRQGVRPAVAAAE